MENLNTGILARLVLPLPPLPEQAAIAKFIDVECHRIVGAITRIEREIELINEFRTTLISDAVTGKIDVRDSIVEATAA